MCYLKKIPLSIQIIFLVIVVMALPLIIAHIQITKEINNNIYAKMTQKAEDISRVMASSSIIKHGLIKPTPIAKQKIQDYTSMMQKISGVKFIVVLDMHSIRISHPNPNKIGKKMVGGDEAAALHGKSYISFAKGSLGLSLRAFRPVFDDHNQQIGFVVVGILSSKIDRTINGFNHPIINVMSITFLLGILLAVLLARQIKTILFGLEPGKIARLLEERTAILESVREGIIAIDQHSLLTVVNSEAKRILTKANISTDIIGKKVNQVIPTSRLLEVLKFGETEYDREMKLNGVSILTNRTPLYVNGQIEGAIATFRDLSEVNQLAEELTGVNRYVEALRASAHEFYNKLHIINGLAHSSNYQALLSYLNDLLNENQQQIALLNQKIRDPIILAFINSKLSRARELGVEFLVDIPNILPETSSTMTHNLITLLNNLVDNGFDAVQSSTVKKVHLVINKSTTYWQIDVIDSGIGIAEEKLPLIFNKGFSTKGVHRGFGLYLVSVALDKLSGTMEISSTIEQGSHFQISIPSFAIVNEVMDD